MRIRSLEPGVVKSLRSDIAFSNVEHCVQELVWNSIDARATCIAVRLNLPFYKIQVIDNGDGIPFEQLALVGKRYATSKCHTLEDLENLQYSGFRGEALSSLKEVSSVLMIESRAFSSSETYCKIFTHGKATDPTVSVNSRPSKGTTITVLGFLYNRPVRKNVISEAIDLEETRKILQSIALIHPEVSFSLQSDATGDICLQFKKCSSVSLAFMQLFGKEKAKNLKLVEHQVEDYKIVGYISTDGFSSKEYQFLYINRHSTCSSRLHKLINKSLNRILGRQREKDEIPPTPEMQSPSKHQGQYCAFVLNITCSHTKYDMVFDRKKTMIEFSEWEKVLKLTEELIRNFLRDEHLNSNLPNETEDIAGRADDAGELRNGQLNLGVDNFKNGLFSHAVKRPEVINVKVGNAIESIEGVGEMEYSGTQGQVVNDYDIGNAIESAHANAILKQDLNCSKNYVCPKPNSVHKFIGLKNLSVSKSILDDLKTKKKSTISDTQSKSHTFTTSSTPPSAGSHLDIPSRSVFPVENPVMLRVPMKSSLSLLEKKGKSSEAFSNLKEKYLYAPQRKIKTFTTIDPSKSYKNKKVDNECSRKAAGPDILGMHADEVKVDDRTYKKTGINLQQQVDKNSCRITSKYEFQGNPVLSPLKRFCRSNRLKSKMHTLQESLAESPVDLMTDSETVVGRSSSICVNEATLNRDSHCTANQKHKETDYHSYLHHRSKGICDTKKMETVFEMNIDVSSKKVADKLKISSHAIHSNLELNNHTPFLKCFSTSTKVNSNLEPKEKDETGVRGDFLQLVDIHRLQDKTLTKENFVTDCSSSSIIDMPLSKKNEISTNSDDPKSSFAFEVFKASDERFDKVFLNASVENVVDNPRSFSDEVIVSETSEFEIDFKSKGSALRICNASYSSDTLTGEMSDSNVNDPNDGFKDFDAMVLLDIPGKSNTLFQTVDLVCESIDILKHEPFSSHSKSNSPPIRVLSPITENTADSDISMSPIFISSFHKPEMEEKCKGSHSGTTNASFSVKQNEISDNTIGIQKTIDISDHMVENSSDTENNALINSKSDNPELMVERNVDSIAGAASAKSSKPNSSEIFLPDINLSEDQICEVHSSALCTRDKDQNRWICQENQENKRAMYIDTITGNSTYINPQSLQMKSSNIADEKPVPDCNKKPHFFLTHDFSPFVPNPSSPDAPVDGGGNDLQVDLDSYIENNERKVLNRKWRHPVEEAQHCDGQSIQSMLQKWENPMFDVPTEVKSVDTKIPVCLPHIYILNSYRFNKNSLDSLRVIGQVDCKFIASIVHDFHDKNTSKRLLVLFDQHAVHERIRLEELIEDLYEVQEDGKKIVKSLPINPSIKMTLEPEEIRLLRTYHTSLQYIGIHISLDDDADTFLVSSLPSCLFYKDTNQVRKRFSDASTIVEKIIKEWLVSLLQSRSVSSILPKTLSAVLNSQACRGAVKFGDPLDLSQCEHLLASLKNCKLPFQCAHGRPSIAPVLDLNKIENLCKRRHPPKLWKLHKEENAE